jgi:hypothetical protein
MSFYEVRGLTIGQLFQRYDALLAQTLRTMRDRRSDQLRCVWECGLFERRTRRRSESTSPRVTHQIGAWIEKGYDLVYDSHSGLIALLRRLVLDHHEPNIIPRKLDEEKQKAFIESYDKRLDSTADSEDVLFVDADLCRADCRLLGTEPRHAHDRARRSFLCWRSSTFFWTMCATITPRITVRESCTTGQLAGTTTRSAFYPALLSAF